MQIRYYEKDPARHPETQTNAAVPLTNPAEVTVSLIAQPLGAPMKKIGVRVANSSNFFEVRHHPQGSSQQPLVWTLMCPRTPMATDWVEAIKQMLGTAVPRGSTPQ